MPEPRCFYNCGNPIDPTDSNVWRRVVGCERKAAASSRKSGSDITLRESREEYAHNSCIELAKRGISPNQIALLGG